MTDDKKTAQKSDKKSDRRPGAALLLIALSAAGLWLAGRAAWLTVVTFDDKSGEAVNDLVGATWAPETTALALTLIAAVGATLILGGIGRRIVGALAAIVAVAASWSPMQLVTTGADPQRALDLLSSGAATQRANAPVTVSDWAQVQELTVHVAGPIAAIIAAARICADRLDDDEPRASMLSTYLTYCKTLGIVPAQRTEPAVVGSGRVARLRAHSKATLRAV